MLTKKCSRCKKTKLFTEFHKNKESPDGLQWWCKKCTRAYISNWEQTKVGKESKAKSRKLADETGRTKEYNRKYYTSPKGLLASKNNRERNSEKVQARNEFRKAMLRGKISYPKRCLKCHHTTQTEAHHYNGYDETHWLDVVFLCRKCHRKEDHK